jgi:molecular chaperone GrpE
MADQDNNTINDELEEKVENQDIDTSEENTSEENTEKETIEEVEKEVEAEPELSIEEKAKIEVAEAKDKYIRLYSEFENFRRRSNKEKLELRVTATQDLLVALLPVVDDFERSQKSFQDSELSEEGVRLKEGIDLIQTKLINILTLKGLKPMESSIGEEFDTDVHEAITQIPAPTEEQKGKIIDEVEKGYTLGEKVIRYAKVVVGS